MNRPVLQFLTVPVLVVLALVLFTWAIAWLSGWRGLAARYANTTPFDPGEWKFVQTSLRRWRLVNFNLTLRIGSDRQYLYLHTWPFPWPGFPELRVPWPDVSADECLIVFRKYCRLGFGGQLGVAVLLPERAFRRVVDGAGGTWTNGKVEFPA